MSLLPPQSVARVDMTPRIIFPTDPRPASRAPPQDLTFTCVPICVVRCGPELVEAGLKAGCTPDDIRGVCSAALPAMAKDAIGPKTW